MKYNKLLWKMKVNQLLIRLGLREPDPIWYIGGSDVLPQPLPRAKEREVLEAMKNGDLGAKSTLIEHNLRLVVYIARRFENTGINIEDLISIGTIGLIKAVNTYQAGQEHQAGHLCLPVHRERDSDAPAQDRQPEGGDLL